MCGGGGLRVEFHRGGGRGGAGREVPQAVLAELCHKLTPRAPGRPRAKGRDPILTLRRAEKGHQSWVLGPCPHTSSLSLPGQDVVAPAGERAEYGVGEAKGSLTVFSPVPPSSPAFPSSPMKPFPFFAGGQNVLQKLESPLTSAVPRLFLLNNSLIIRFSIIHKSKTITPMDTPSFICSSSPSFHWLKYFKVNNVVCKYFSIIL